MESYLPLLLKLPASIVNQNWLSEVILTYRGITVPAEISIEHPDVHVINQPDETLKIEQVRTLQELSSFSPYQLPISIFVIHTIETASVAAQNALLKILEEPPESVWLILTTQDAAKVLPTIRSRCQSVELEQVSPLSISESGVSETYQQIMTFNHGELITLSEMYSDRTQALELIQNLTNYLHQELEKQADTPTASVYIQQLLILLEAHQWLEKNVNAKLALAECFFQLKAKQPILWA